VHVCSAAYRVFNPITEALEVPEVVRGSSAGCVSRRHRRDRRFDLYRCWGWTFRYTWKSAQTLSRQLLAEFPAAINARQNDQTRSLIVEARGGAKLGRYFADGSASRNGVQAATSRAVKARLLRPHVHQQKSVAVYLRAKAYALASCPASTFRRAKTQLSRTLRRDRWGGQKPTAASQSGAARD